jgi:hypothetical protein
MFYRPSLGAALAALMTMNLSSQAIDLGPPAPPFDVFDLPPDLRGSRRGKVRSDARSAGARAHKRWKKRRAAGRA